MEILAGKQGYTGNLGEVLDQLLSFVNDLSETTLRSWVMPRLYWYSSFLHGNT